MTAQRAPRLRREPVYRGEAFGPAGRGWTVVQWTVSGKLRLVGKAIWVDRAPPWKPSRGRWVWRMIATAPWGGRVEWRWDPDRGDYECRVAGLMPDTSADAVSLLWRDAQRLLNLAKDAGGRPPRVRDFRAALAQVAEARRSGDIRRAGRQQIADDLGYSVRQFGRRWEAERDRDSTFPSFEDWLAENELD